VTGGVPIFAGVIGGGLDDPVASGFHLWAWGGYRRMS
jgi:hypothetical protein